MTVTIRSISLHKPAFVVYHRLPIIQTTSSSSTAFGHTYLLQMFSTLLDLFNKERSAVCRRSSSNASFNCLQYVRGLLRVSTIPRQPRMSSECTGTQTCCCCALSIQLDIFPRLSLPLCLLFFHTTPAGLNSRCNQHLLTQSHLTAITSECHTARQHEAGFVVGSPETEWPTRGNGDRSPVI